MKTLKILSVLMSFLVIAIIINLYTNPYKATWSHSGSASILNNNGSLQQKGNTIIYTSNNKYLTKLELKALVSYTSDSTKIFIINK